MKTTGSHYFCVCGHDEGRRLIKTAIVRLILTFFLCGTVRFEGYRKVEIARRTGVTNAAYRRALRHSKNFLKRIGCLSNYTVFFQVIWEVKSCGFGVFKRLVKREEH